MSIDAIKFTTDDLELQAVRRAKKPLETISQKTKKTERDFFDDSQKSWEPKGFRSYQGSASKGYFVSFSDPETTNEPIRGQQESGQPKITTKEADKLSENFNKLQKLIEERLGLSEEASKQWLENWDKQMAEAFDKYGEDGEVSQEDINRLNALGDQVFENSKGNAGIQNQAGSDQAIMDKLTKDLLHERIQLMKEKTWINYWNANLSGIKASAKLASTT